ncbi:MAG: hypothetical protein ACKOF3_13375 [Spartobacteria bacterium]
MSSEIGDWEGGVAADGGPKWNKKKDFTGQGGEMAPEGNSGDFLHSYKHFIFMGPFDYGSIFMAHFPVPT